MKKLLALCMLVIVLFTACRKDQKADLTISETITSQNSISNDALKRWISSNKVGNYIIADWTKAEQKVIEGVSVVKVPVKTFYNAASSESKKQSLSTSAPTGPDTVRFFDPKHPPMLFFLKKRTDLVGDSLKAVMLNFIPDDPTKENGEGNIWTGKLIEWNLIDDKIQFQTLQKSYVKNIGSISKSQLDNYQNSSSKKAVTAKYKSMNIFEDIWNALKWVTEAVGYFFGVPGDYNHFYQGSLGWCDFLWGLFCGSGDGGNPTGTSSGGGSYYGGGLSYDGIYGGYINGYNGATGSNNWSSYDGSSVDQSNPCPGTAVAISSNYKTMVANATGNGCPVYVPVPDLTLVDDVSFPMTIDFPELGDPLFVNDETFDPNALDFANADSWTVDNYTTFYSLGKPVGDYPDNHPVSVAVRNFNPWIFSSFRESSNSSIRYFHMTAKDLDSGDGYKKALGAIGEGLFAQRIAMIPSISRSRLMVNAVVKDSYNPAEKVAVDVLSEHKFTEAEQGYSFMTVNHTDRYGNSINTKLKLRRNSLSHREGFMMINVGYVAYEVKTYNPNNTPLALWSGFQEGVRQTLHRAMFRNMTVGILVFDKAAFEALYNSPYRNQVDALLDKIKNLKNPNGDQAAFLKLEENLWLDSNRAFFALKGQIAGIP